MNSNRIQEIQQATAYPDSISVMNALLQVWHECQTEINSLSEYVDAYKADEARTQAVIEAMQKEI